MPRLTLRRLVTLALLAALVGGVVLVAAVLAGWLPVYAAALLALNAAVLGAVGVVAIGVRRVLRRQYAGFQASRALLAETRAEVGAGAGSLDRATERVQDALADFRGAAGEDRVELLLRLEQLTGELDRASARLDQVESSLAELPQRVADPVRRAIDDSAAAAPVKAAAALYPKVEAYADLRALVTPRAPLPPLGGWALDADVLHAVAAALWQQRPKLVVECGSGSSTVWLGYLAERLGLGRVVSLEHDDRYLQASRALVVAHQLQEIVEIRHAPLQDWSDGAAEPQPWYALAAVSDLEQIGLLLVDGPPQAIGRQSRYPAGPVLLPRCEQGAVIVLDDTHRVDEDTIVARWQREWPGLRLATHQPASARVLLRAGPEVDAGGR